MANEPPTSKRHTAWAVALILALGVMVGGDRELAGLGLGETAEATPNGPQASVGLYWFYTGDPTTGGGIQAPLYQLLVRIDVPSVYWKSGTAATAWTNTDAGGGGSSVTGSGTAPDLAIWTAAHTLGNYAGSACTAGSAAFGITGSGQVLCEAVGSGSITGSGSANTIPKFTGSNTIGNSSATDNATTYAIGSGGFSVTEAIGAAIAQELDLPGTLAASALGAGPTNNWDPAGTGNLNGIERIDEAPSANATVSGLVVGRAGQIISIHNTSTSFTLTLTNADGGSTSANQFTLPNAASYPIPPGGAFTIRTSSTVSGWRPWSSGIQGTGTSPDLAIFSGGNTIANYAGSACAAGSAVTGVTASGQATCVALTAGTVTESGSPSANQSAVFSSATNIIPGTTTDNGTTFKVGNEAVTDTVDSTATGTTNNYALGATTTWLVLSNSGGGAMTGITGGVDGRELDITATGTTGWTFVNESASSTAANRLTMPSSVTWSINGGAFAQTLHFRYDGNSSRWRPIITSQFASAIQGGAFNGAAVTSSSTVSVPEIVLNSPGSISGTGTQDNVSIGAVSIIRWTGTSNAIYDGFVAPANNQFFVLINASTTSSVSLTIATEAAGSTAANRIQGTANSNVVLQGSTANQNNAAFLWYDLTTARWRVIVAPPGLKGSITLASGTGTATVGAGQSCVCTDSTSATAVGCSVSTTTLTATITGGISTDVVTYHCF